MSPKNRNIEKQRVAIDDITIHKETIKPGENALVRINVGKLPSGTKINIKAHVFNGLKPGPTVLVLGGVHGDEINGVEIIRSILADEHFEKINAGTIVAIPIVNIYGFINFSRAVPDGKDVNRSFPGSMNGSLASRVARVISSKILPHVDYIIDLHTGGASRYNYPQIRYTGTDEKAFELAKAFGAPFILKKPVITRSLRKIARDKKVPIIIYEGGESLRFDGHAIFTGVNGILRVLNHLEMLECDTSDPDRLLHFGKTTWVRAPRSGLFMWTKKSGSRIQQDEIIGVVNDPQGLSTVSVMAPKDGYIIGHNNASVVNQGDALFHISTEYERL